MANILARPLLKLAPRLRDLTRVGGILILSGCSPTSPRNPRPLPFNRLSSGSPNQGESGELGNPDVTRVV